MSYPVPGNHDYESGSAAGYFDYFNGVGAFSGRAGDRDKGYYSFDLGAWHVIALNSNCSAVGGCGTGSPQEVWLASDLAAHASQCTLAYWHHPRFNSGSAGNDSTYQPFWQDLYNANADLILAGHSHTYERFAPLDPTGTINTTRGIREIIAGTGGKSFQAFGTIRAGSEARNNTTFGVLKLALYPTRYDWEFDPEPGKPFTDSGSTSCH